MTRPNDKPSVHRLTEPITIEPPETKVEVEVISKEKGEITEDSLLMEPFFRKRSDAVRIQRLKTLPERKAVADAYAEVGCLHCGSHKRPHDACGLCTVCRRWYANLLQRKIRERLRGELD